MYHHSSRAAKTGRVVARDVREFTGFCSVNGIRLSAGSLHSLFNLYRVQTLVCSTAYSGDRKTAWKTGNKESEEFEVPER